MEIKVVDLGFVTVTAGMAVFPVSYVINDCIVEIYGFRRARLVIWLGFAMNLLVSVLLQIGILLPGSSEWTGQESMEMLFGAVPRIFVASFTAFICGSMVNAYVMSRMKRGASVRERGSIKSFSLRAVVSTLWGESVDSAIFFPIAFAGVLSWPLILKLMITQAFLKTMYEIIILPVTVKAVARIRRIEGGDVTDSDDVSYKWWRIKEV